ncbi:MAG: hypothetical protein Q8K04_00990 [Lutibacter sp.]|nr:hypothetical protein [Lutibacter sp.]
MINYLFPGNTIHTLSRPQTPAIKYTSLIDFTSEQLIGAGGQNPINAGSSMFVDTPNLEPRIKDLINAHFTKDSYLFKYGQRPIDNVTMLAALNFIDFKNDLVKRQIILDHIFDRETRTFKNDIYGSYIFIFISLYFALNFTLFNRNSTPHSKIIANKYFSDETDLLNKIIDALYNAPNIENLNALCHGRYFFIDSKLCDFQDFKPVPIKVIELLKNNI